MSSDQMNIALSSLLGIYRRIFSRTNPAGEGVDYEVSEYVRTGPDYDDIGTVAHVPLLSPSDE